MFAKQAGSAFESWHCAHLPVPEEISLFALEHREIQFYRRTDVDFINMEKFFSFFLKNLLILLLLKGTFGENPARYLPGMRSQ